MTMSPLKKYASGGGEEKVCGKSNKKSQGGR